jgi:beta-glucosidase
MDAHLTAISAALTQSANVQAYYHSFLMDNLEWTDGYSHRFGLVFVDFPTQRRIPKRSFYWYAEQIRMSPAGSQSAGESVPGSAADKPEGAANGVERGNGCYPADVRS